MTVLSVQMFPPTALTATAATLYTVIGGSSSNLMRARIRFTNTSGLPVQVTAYDVPPGGTAGTANIFCPNLTIPAESNLDIDVPVMTGGSFIQAFASVAGVVIAHALNGIIFF